VEAGPPVLIEKVVRLLLPAPTREHVLGDLAERYSTPAGYVGEALRTVPFVVVSQIRRTAQFALAPLIALTLFGGFATGRNVTWLHAIIPAVATMIGLMLRDAYKIRDPRRLWRQGAVDVSVAAAFAAGSQALVAAVRPDLLIGPAGVLGGAAALGMLYLLRIQNPGRPAVCAPAADAQMMTLAQLREEVEGYALVMRRSVRIEIAASIVLIPLFSTFTVMGRTPPARIGAALTVVGGMLVLWRMYRVFKSITPIPADAGFSEIAATYRARLLHQQHGLRTIWLWYLLPLTLGPAVLFGTAAQHASRPEIAAIVMALGFIVLWASIVWPARQHARKMQVRINALERVEEQR
jgi:hypothetical protein